METGLTVYVPNMFRLGRPYRVAYLFHGLGSGSGSWCDYTMLATHANDYDAVIVMPEVHRSFYTDMKFGQNFFKYVSDELPRIVQSVFNISAKREDTVVMGASMGGYGALKCALTFPEQYSACCSIAAVMFFAKKYFSETNISAAQAKFGMRSVNDFQAAFGPELELDMSIDISELVRKTANAAERPRILSICGTKDPYLKENQQFRDYMADFPYDFTYLEQEGGHDWYLFDSALRQGLEFCFGEK